MGKAPSARRTPPAAKPARVPALDSLAAAIDAVAASFTPEAIAQVQDAPKRAQLLLGLTRARKLLADKPARKTAAPPPAPPADLGARLSEDEWTTRFPPR